MAGCVTFKVVVPPKEKIKTKTASPGSPQAVASRAGIDLTKRKSDMHFFELQVETKKN